LDLIVNFHFHGLFAVSSIHMQTNYMCIQERRVTSLNAPKYRPSKHKMYLR